MEKKKRGLPKPNPDFPNNLWISIIAGALLLGLLGGYSASLLLAKDDEPDRFESEAIVGAMDFQIGDTDYYLRIFPYDNDQTTRRMTMLVLWHQLTEKDGYEVGRCFTENGSIIPPYDMVDLGIYQDDWEFWIDRRVNDARGSISIPVAGAPAFVPIVFSCST